MVGVGISYVVVCSRCTMLSPQELGLLQDYLLALTTDDHLLRCAAQVLSHLALALGLPAGGSCPHPRGQDREPELVA